MGLLLNLIHYAVPLHLYADTTGIIYKLNLSRNQIPIDTEKTLNFIIFIGKNHLN